MFKELKKRNFKVDLPIRVRDYIKKELGFDVVHTLTNVSRLDVRFITPSQYLKYPTAVYEISGMYTGLSYQLRFYARLGNTPIITPKLIDAEEKPMLASLRYGFMIMIPEHELVPYRNLGRFPIIYDDIITRRDWCLASALPIYDASGLNYCTVIVDEPPTVTLLGDSTVVLPFGTIWEDPGATASDPEDGDISSDIVIYGTVPTDSNGWHIPGTYNITYTVTDSNDGIAQETRTVIIQENNIPVITLSSASGGTTSPVVIIQGGNYIEPGYSANDVEDGNITDDVTVDTSDLDLNTPGDYTVTYTVTDRFGRTSTADRIVQVIPDEYPTITLIGDNYGNKSPIAISITHSTTLAEYQAKIPGATAVDNEDGDLTDDIITTLPTVLESGSYNAIYRVTDSFGHMVTVNRIINLVVEDLPPELTLLPDANGYISPITLYVRDGTSLEEFHSKIPIALAADNEDGDLTDDIVTTLPTTVSSGTSVVTYTVTDSVGHTVSKERILNVIIIPNEPPVITLLADSSGDISPITIHITANTTLEEYQAMIPGATASDPEDGDITDNIITTLPSTLVSGSYTASYSVADRRGATTTKDRVIYLIKDNVVPTITLLEDASGFRSEITLTVLSTATVNDIIAMIPGATAYDAEDGDITDDIVIDQLPTENVEGLVRVRYRVSDSENASITVYRDVTIEWAPDISIDVNYANPLTIDETTSNNWDTVYRDDYTIGYPNSDWNVVITGDTVDTSVEGTYTVTYTVTDTTYGATDEVVVTVNIQGAGGPPTIVLLGDNPVYYESPSVDYGYVEPGYIATDPQLGDVTSEVVVTEEVTEVNSGLHVVKTYTITTVNGTDSTTRDVWVMLPEVW